MPFASIAPDELLPGLSVFAGTLATAVGQIVIYGGGLIAMGYGLFRMFGMKWLEARFSERLQRLKTAQDEQLRHAQAVIDREIHRARKLYDREFEVLPQTWSLFCRIFDMAAATGMSRYPILDRYTAAELEDFLQGSDMRDFEKTEFRSLDPDQRTKRYRYWAEHRRLHRCYDARIEFREHLATQSIFFSDGIRERFAELDRLIGLAIAEFEVRLNSLEFQTFEHLLVLTKKGGELRKELEELIRERLWSSDKRVSLV